MADVRVGQINDALTRLLESVGALIDGRNPSKRLMRRRDVVAVGSEDHERVLNGGEIDGAVVVDPHPPLLQLVADEQVLDDRYDFLAAQPVEAIPPALEVEEAIRLRVDPR